MGESELDKELRKQKKYWKKNNIWMIVILAAAVLYYALSAPKIQLSFGSDTLQVTEPDGNVVSIRYAEIQDVQMEKNPDYGRSDGGKEASGCRYGVWTNSAWGRYELCVYSKTAPCVVIRTADGVLAVNDKSEQATETLYETLRGKLIT